MYKLLFAPLCAAAAVFLSHAARADDVVRVRFVVVDPQARLLVAGAYVTIEDARAGLVHAPHTLRTGVLGEATMAFDAAHWAVEASDKGVRVVVVPLGETVYLRQPPAPTRLPPGTPPPVQDIYVKVTASRVQARSNVTNAGTARSTQEINTFVNRTSNDTKALVRGQSGVASDSNGQQHVRGEHADIAFVVDGVPLPDALSGQQSSVVVASTIQSLEILTGGFAPEFGGQTAAILNIGTLPGAKTFTSDATIQGGEYQTLNANITASGPVGSRASYVFNLASTKTSNAVEPQQPDAQTAHNAGESQSYFAKFRVAPTRADSVTLTLSRAPSRSDISNRTGLGSRFTQAGQGFGFLGLRNRDGTRPDASDDNAGFLGAQTLVLPSQQDARQSLDQHEINEFGVLAWRHTLSPRDVLQLSGVLLHSGQDVDNRNPVVDVANLPVDSSIEYNPTARRSVYHYQVNGDVSARRGAHQFKTGFLFDKQNGKESYQIVSASQLALNELAALGPALAPEGAASAEATDINGNPVFTPAPGATTPTLRVSRNGSYGAAYVQDTWKATRQLTANYGVRFDRYNQNQNLDQPDVDKSLVSPRLNLSYTVAKETVLRASYNRLFNVPPLAQGAVVGQPIQPETLHQYDASVERTVARGQTAKAAYYYKQIENQVDTGLFIPGSQIGLYSAVNLQYGGVHGLELSYEVAPPGGVGLDGYLNYTYSIARPNGLDNTGAPVPEYNDHDQRHTLGAGLAYLWKGGASLALTATYGSGLASSPIPPSTRRIPRSQVDVRVTSGPKLFGGKGGVGLDVSNIFDSREVINFQSAFSGTRFQQARRVLLSVFGSF